MNSFAEASSSADVWSKFIRRKINLLDLFKFKLSDYFKLLGIIKSISYKLVSCHFNLRMCF